MRNRAAARRGSPLPIGRMPRPISGVNLLKIAMVFSALGGAILSPQAAQAGPKVASVYCGSDTSAQSDVQRRLQDSKLFDKVDSIDMTSSLPSLATLLQYDSVLAWTDANRGCGDPGATGNLLAQYIEAGGGVVQMLPYYTNNLTANIGGDFYSRYALVNQGSMTSQRSLSMGMKTEPHAVLDGVMSVSMSGYTCYNRTKFSSSDLRNGGRIILNWSDGNAMVIVGSPNGHNRVDLNMYPPSSDIGYYGCLDAKSDAYKLIAQSLLWTIGPLRATPNSIDFGDVPVGIMSYPITVEVRNNGADALTLSGGSMSPASEFTAKLAGGATFPLTLNMGDSVSVEFTARPSTGGKRQAYYTLNVSTGGASALTLPLSVNGLGPAIKVTPGSVNFGGVVVGSMPRVATITVSNTGGGILNLRTAPTLSDTTNFQIVNPLPIPLSLAPSASVSFDVKFTPTTEKVHSATLDIPYNDGTPRSAQVVLGGSYGKPKISVPLTFGMTPVRVNQPGPEQSFFVNNTGLADLTISGVAFTGRDAAEFLALTLPTMGSPIVVPPGGSGELRIQCNPTVQGLRLSTLNLTSDDPAMGLATVALSCTGVMANFEVQPEKVEFSPSQQTGQCSKPQMVTIKNSGTDNLRLLSVSLAGPNASSFQHTITGPRTIPMMNGQLQIPVSFCPTDIGAQTAELVLSTDYTAGHIAKVTLTGTGTGPKVVATPGNIDFGPVYINTKSATKTITISNAGDQALVFGKNALTPASGPFKVMGLPAEGTKLNKGDPPITLSLLASPLMAMQTAGELTIAINDQVKSGNLRIPLSVVGTQAGITVQPMMLTFDPTVQGTTSQPKLLTVTNTGQAPLTGIDVTVIAGTSTPATDFIADLSMVPTTASTGQSFQIPISFRPSAGSTRSAVVVIKAAGLPAPEQVKVEGTGKLLTISCMPDTKNFGSILVGQEKTDTVICKNTDSSPIDYVAAFGDFAEDWTVAPSMGTLAGAVGGTEGIATFTLTFHPTGTGPRITALTIKTKDGIPVGVVNLNGTGAMPPKDKPPVDVGCDYSRRPVAPHAFLLMLIVLSGLLLRRRYV